MRAEQSRGYLIASTILQIPGALRFNFIRVIIHWGLLRSTVVLLTAKHMKHMQKEPMDLILEEADSTAYLSFEGCTHEPKQVMVFISHRWGITDQYHFENQKLFLEFSIIKFCIWNWPLPRGREDRGFGSGFITQWEVADLYFLNVLFKPLHTKTTQFEFSVRTK